MVMNPHPFTCTAQRSYHPLERQGCTRGSLPKAMAVHQFLSACFGACLGTCLGDCLSACLSTYLGVFLGAAGEGTERQLPQYPLQLRVPLCTVHPLDP